jgi:hypothetical protein
MPELIVKEDAHYWPEFPQESFRNCAEICQKSDSAVGARRDRVCAWRAGGMGGDVEQNTSQKHPELEPTNACRCVFFCILMGNKTMLSPLR